MRTPTLKIANRRKLLAALIIAAGILLGIIIWYWFEHRIEQIKLHSTQGYIS